MTIRNVLFVGTGNSARSIMAEAYMNHAGRGLFRAFSAGNAPIGEVNPLALETLRDVGVRARNLSSTSWELFALPAAPRMDLVITLCNAVAEIKPPVWPGAPAIQHWPLADPSEAGISLGLKKAAYLDVFAQLRQNVDALLLQEPPLGTLIEHAARGEVLAVDP
ncbi:MAG: arsenate reductase ArsC [Hyphomicrobiales bacterium]